MFTRPSSFLAVLLAVSTPALAFYPYHLETLLENSKDARVRNAPRAENAKDITRGSINLPLRRTPVKRQTPQYTIISALEPTQTGSAGIDTVPGDFIYIVDMKYGSSNKEFHMLVDTAASNTWVMSSSCTTEICKAHNTLGQSDSPSLEVYELLLEPPR